MTDADIWVPKGALTFATASAVRRELGASKPSRIDLTGVTEADSAALALLVSLARELKSAGKRLSVAGMPEGMSDLADLYGVSALFDSTAPAQ